MMYDKQIWPSDCNHIEKDSLDSNLADKVENKIIRVLALGSFLKLHICFSYNMPFEKRKGGGGDLSKN